MKYLLVGPGALGCLLYSKLSEGISKTRDSISILDYNSARTDKLNKQGIIYHLGEKRRSFSVSASLAADGLMPIDVIIVCVKSYDIVSTLKFCQPLLQKDTLLLFMQNGIGHLQLKPHLGEATAAYGTTTEGATLLGPGQVRHAGSGATYLGFLQTPTKHFTDLLDKTRKSFQDGGMQISITDTILARLWAKLFVNVGINALTATLDCKNGQLLTIAGVTDRMQSAIDEATTVARAKGIPITSDDPLQQAKTVAAKTGDNISSMLQDVRNRRKTEIDAINGAIVSEGLHLEIPTPENDLLTRQIKELETNYPKTHPE